MKILVRVSGVRGEGKTRLLRAIQKFIHEKFEIEREHFGFEDTLQTPGTLPTEEYSATLKSAK